jgi:peroxin-4
MNITISNDYPVTPPSITFVSKVFHPNVNFGTGEICLDILKKEWSPAWSVEVIKAKKKKAKKE